MSLISSRLYKDHNDFWSMVDLLTKVRPLEHRNDFPTRINLEENLASTQTQKNTRLWFDDDQLIGWAYVDDLQNLGWELECQYGEEIGDEIVNWGMSCVRQLPSQGESPTLDASCREDYFERVEFLERRGFYRTGNVTVHMQRDLLESISKPTLPEGYVIRSVTGVEEAEAIASLHRATLGSDYMTTENRLAIMNTSEYDPSLDLVIVAPDGTLAAYCTCSVNLADKIGSTDPVATHPRFQRLGLARALLLTGLSLLKERGMEKAGLGTSGDNIAMQKSAESVGFDIVHKIIWFEKRIA